MSGIAPSSCDAVARLLSEQCMENADRHCHLSREPASGMKTLVAALQRTVACGQPLAAMQRLLSILIATRIRIPSKLLKPRQRNCARWNVGFSGSAISAWRVNDCFCYI